MTDYDNITEDYKLVKTTFFHHYSETYTVFKLLNDLTDKSVIDIACGDGYYSRSIKELGASRVVGVDISREMIEIAKNYEAVLPLGIEYIVQDIVQLENIGSFDLALAIYFFHYLSTKGAVLEACEAISSNLKPGGKLIAALVDPHIPSTCPFDIEKYGFYWEFQEPRQDGAKIKTKLLLGKEILKLENYYWSKKVYGEVLKTSGFTRIKWHPIEVSEDGKKKFGDKYWNDLKNNSPLIFLEAVKE